ncbi:PREDICTED: uncharacterized protein LOC108618165 [Drosophila arizonae]|uniref:Uncharacterized protein LOC108618165 n=1 Tax=Drosophila arizonae TaxID=7263 RepID=A0ABM1PQS1_DROAR|nr:PREDICTED: uncharacterized protein LOC108618165 [Drosophila arizonae]
MRQLALLWALLAALTATQAALQRPPHGYDDDNTPLQLSLEDLEREQEQRLDLNRLPLLPTHYEWHPSVAASVPPSYIHDAAKLEQLQLNGVQYLNGNALPAPTTTVLPRPIPRPVPRPLRPPYAFLQQQHHHHLAAPSQRPSLSSSVLLPQSKQFAYAPVGQRNYAPGTRIPLPYPPSFVSITTRRPASGYAGSYSKPFRPSQPDLTPDLFAGRDSKSLLDSYIPSWEVLRLYQQHQTPRPFQSHTLAYAVPIQRVFKRDSQPQTVPERSRIVKKSLDKQLAPH